jgi:hypothetical protein
MIEINFAWRFALCALAIWRIAHLLARENGPWGLIARLRATLGSGVVGRLMDCFYSLSFLLSLSPAIWMSISRIGFLVQWLALSAVACLLESAMQGWQRNRRVIPISTSYLDKVIGGV